MRNDSGVAKVVDSSEALDGHGETGGEHFVKNRHGVGNVDDTVVFDDFGDEVSMAQVVGDGHADTKDHAVGVALEHGLHVPLGL